ncbi:hypothetical protein EDD18DRAFT_1080622 [Armillaria luteobubalina]|uniref:Integrase core domain-containing protein n=1 Tax=Armillaria luteobubalina TaxID=153913 RepID=A0AA39PTC7_9AGAR|nr:hypothetical protein EDD18DRAFT_1080622 [Armillaria luteobubalina]
MENYQGIICNSYIWGRSMHNTRVERMWRDTTVAFSNKWKGFFYVLEGSHLLNLLLNQHVWLLHFLFLGKIDGDCQKWANHWNNHKLSLHGCSASPLQIWMESQLLHRARSLEHLMPDDPRIAAPLAAVPNMGLNEEMLSQLCTRQRICIHTPEIFEPESSCHLLVLRSLAYVPCDPPNNPFSPQEFHNFRMHLEAITPDTDSRMEYQMLCWIHSLSIMSSILAACGTPIPADL